MRRLMPNDLLGSCLLIALSTAPAMSQNKWPPIPDGPMIVDDRKYLTAPKEDTGTSYYRREYLVRFSKDATGAQVRAFIDRHHATIVGGRREWLAYLFLIDDPGPRSDPWAVVSRWETSRAFTSRFREP